jgi:K+-sensing histidine kinase KdpD
MDRLLLNPVMPWHDFGCVPKRQPTSIDKFCEPFWRRSTAGNREGLGLGPYICSQIVRAHGGTLSVTSDEESGTHFTVRLPLDSNRLDQNTRHGRTQ